MARVFSSWQVSRRGAGRASAHHTTVAEAYYLMLSARALWQQSKSFKSGRRGRFLANSHTPVHGGHRAVLNRRRSGSREAGRAQRKHLGQRQQESLARSRMNESPGCGPLKRTKNECAHWDNACRLELPDVRDARVCWPWSVSSPWRLLLRCGLCRCRLRHRSRL